MAKFRDEDLPTTPAGWAELAGQLEAERDRARERREESFQRCDTDGFLSQWALGCTSQECSRQIEIAEAGGTAEFIGLYEAASGRRIKAKLITTDFGTTWLLHDDEGELIRRRGKKFVPEDDSGFPELGMGSRSKIQVQLGLVQRKERAPAWAKLTSDGTGLSGNVWTQTFRTGCPWGSDATPIAAPVEPAAAGA